MQNRIHRKVRLGILFHGNKLWLSELWTVAFVTVILGTLVSISTTILLNEHKIRTLDQTITSLKLEKVVLSHQFDDFVAQQRIANILNKFTRYRISPVVINRLSRMVYNNSMQFGYDPMLLLAVIHVESVFDASAKGQFRSGNLSGAVGLMQLKPETAMHVAKSLDMAIKPSDILLPEVNLFLGVAYLTQLIRQFKSFKLGLLAYNQGPGAVMHLLSKKEPLSIDYYKKVLKSYYKLREIARDHDGPSASIGNR